jgi:hypothetical protein
MSSSDPPSSGFQGQIKGASLADLVQMECLAGSHRVVRVTSANDVGYMYFQAGAVVHAAARALTGEAAVLEMLQWSEGTFEAVEREWPTKETIASTWQSLLLRAAQIHDESRGRSVVTMRPDGRIRANADRGRTVDNIEFDVTPIQVGGHTLRGEDFHIVLRLGANGAVLMNQGSTEDFADMAAYAARLSELIGILLGVDRFVAMECVLKEGPCFIVMEDDGSVVALRPRPFADVSSVRELFGI